LNYVSERLASVDFWTLFANSEADPAQFAGFKQKLCISFAICIFVLRFMVLAEVKFGRMSKETRAILCQFIVLIKPPKICVPLIENIQTLYKEDAWILLLR